MSKRYKVVGDWQSIRSEQVADPWSEAKATLDVALADVQDTRTGDRFRDGARRVTVKAKGKNRRQRVFIGERAYDEARRWTDDVLREVGL